METTQLHEGHRLPFRFRNLLDRYLSGERPLAAFPYPNIYLNKFVRSNGKVSDPASRCVEDRIRDRRWDADHA